MQIITRLVDYAVYREVLHQIRHTVFVQEQGVPADIEIDCWDPLCTHALAWHQSKPVGTGRLLPDGHIGRVAVVPSMRQRGIGTQIMQRLLQAASHQGHSNVKISAQYHATAFYHRLGFVESGQVYQEVGIDHIKMMKPLTTAPRPEARPNQAGALAIGAATLWP